MVQSSPHGGQKMREPKRDGWSLNISFKDMLPVA